MPVHAARAQWSRLLRGNEPLTPFSVAEFSKLRWLEGSWQAVAPGEAPLFERYHFVSDSAIEITYFRDSTLSRPTGTGRMYLTVGRIYFTFGPNRWGATNVDGRGAYFVPQLNAHNSFEWSVESPDAWTSTLRTGISGRERVTVFRMTRIKH